MLIVCSSPLYVSVVCMHIVCSSPLSLSVLSCCSNGSSYHSDQLRRTFSVLLIILPPLFQPVIFVVRIPFLYYSLINKIPLFNCYYKQFPFAPVLI
jgi:hypothetical protein